MPSRSRPQTSWGPPSTDVLATNRVADALLSPFGEERNMPRILFTHPRAKTVFAEWPVVAAATVDALRLNEGRFPGGQHISRLVAQLTERSQEFRRRWAAQTVGALTRAFKVFVHPEVGRIEQTCQTFDAHDAPGQQLLVGTPQPGTRSARSEEGVAHLAAMTAPA
ncbi:MmyB family transcriptional regulator [Streptomyces chromofuscus]|uniref:MmyB family transcriptional regulator n=1 Tax=Streptomyces chromofuscus TaxID=42881 RepID=UPI0019ABE13B|nr:hypothetical protein [Streptomyces chromofuscus]GGT41068.1 hypothetical protein GCM10010254_71070 [Streptomyces chromofuscus]